MARQTFPKFFAGIACLSLTACFLPLSIDQQAYTLGLRKFRLLGQGFEHLVYTKGELCATGKLHVYLEGDGLAWLPGSRIASDPTPSYSCLLPLMALDPNPSVYLGRPCYHGLAKAPGCHPELWTQARYGEAVVASMVQALLQLTQGKSCRPVLIGYSGGGALAVLIAQRLAQTVSGVVTLAGNLDLGAWTSLHRYTPLDGSLDPAKLPPLPETIFQIHIAGERDNNIPAFLIRKEASRQPGARFLLLPRHAHACPPNNLWPGILAAISGLEPIQSAKTAPCVRLNR